MLMGNSFNHWVGLGIIASDIFVKRREGFDKRMFTKVSFTLRIWRGGKKSDFINCFAIGCPARNLIRLNPERGDALLVWGKLESYLYQHTKKIEVKLGGLQPMYPNFESIIRGKKVLDEAEVARLREIDKRMSTAIAEQMIEDLNVSAMFMYDPDHGDDTQAGNEHYDSDQDAS